MDTTIQIGGEAGQGIVTIGDTLAKVFSRHGVHVLGSQDYESRIRGGHNLYRIRLSEQPVQAIRERIDILVALDAESIHQHSRELVGTACGSMSCQTPGICPDRQPAALRFLQQGQYLRMVPPARGPLGTRLRSHGPSRHFCSGA